MNPTRCAACGKDGHTRVVEREDGRKLGYPPHGWHRIVVLTPEKGKHETERRDACSYRCFRAIVNGLVIATLPPDMREAVEKLQSEVRALLEKELEPAKKNPEREGMN
jgi:hypothetical protein